ncbi:MAG TPA: hypothetical protein VJX92_24690 [Methylomirabilota bacterium]|nr:hypothetical protein [Methylomirabilota bacterium]
MTTQNPGLKQGAILMVIAALAFIGYAVVFFIRNFTAAGFELGVETLNGVTRDQLNALNPAIVHYIGHLHVATAGFIAGTGIAVAALSWYGVARGENVGLGSRRGCTRGGTGRCAALPLHGHLSVELGDPLGSDLPGHRHFRCGRPDIAARDGATLRHAAGHRAAYSCLGASWPPSQASNTGGFSR